jgi:hypothetical protein
VVKTELPRDADVTTTIRNSTVLAGHCNPFHIDANGD